MKPTLLEALKTRVLLGDGAMGTQLMLAGLEQGACGEAWNLTHPERVLAIQRRYAEAGSDCILTNTFGGSRSRLELHGNQDRVDQLIRAYRTRGHMIAAIDPLGFALENFDALRLCSQVRSLERTRNLPVLAVADADNNARLLRGLEIGFQTLDDPLHGFAYMNHPPGVAWAYHFAGWPECACAHRPRAIRIPDTRVRAPGRQRGFRSPCCS